MEIKEQNVSILTDSMKLKILEDEETKKEIGMTIESVDNIDVAHALAKKYNIEMPIVNAVYDVLYNGLKPSEAVTRLMTREKKSE